MAALGSLGNLLANNQTAFKTNAYQALAQQQSAYITSTAATAGTIAFWPNQYSQTYTLSIDGNGSVTPTPPKAKTNLDWLDERVNEMRVRL